MTDVDQGHTDAAAHEAAAAQRRGRAVRDEAIETVKGEQRSFAKAADDVMTATQGATNAVATNASDAARAGHDAMRKASGQAAELWRASFDPLTSLHTEFSRWMEQTWRQGMAMRLQSGPLLGEAFLAALSGAPASDIYETDAGMTLVVELPGLTAKDVRLTHAGDTLILSGARSETASHDQGSYRVRERRSGEFRRIFALPAGLDVRNIDARFDHGVLTIAVPRGEGAAAQEQDIQIKG